MGCASGEGDAVLLVSFLQQKRLCERGGSPRPSPWRRYGVPAVIVVCAV